MIKSRVEKAMSNYIGHEVRKICTDALIVGFRIALTHEKDYIK